MTAPSGDAPVRVELLYFDGCPNWRLASERIDRVAAGRNEISFTRRLVETPEEAEMCGFRGSPSILVNGVDPFATASDPVGLSCRVYQTSDGPAGSPSMDQIRIALDEA